MMRYHRNSVGSLALDRSGAAGSFRLWPVLSTAAFRRKLIDTMRCGASCHRREEEEVPSVAMSSEQQPQLEAEKRMDSSSKRNAGGSERLSDLLSSEARESGLDEAEMKRKMVVFEEMRGVVRRLQGAEQRREAAMEVRRLAKEDAEARVTLAMLGAIPPLVGMLDSEDAEFQIAALYGLLNLGIGNDMFFPLVLSRKWFLEKMIGKTQVFVLVSLKIHDIFFGDLSRPFQFRKVPSFQSITVVYDRIYAVSFFKRLSPKNKAAIVKAGALHRMLKLMENPSKIPAVSEAIVANFLGLSALDLNKPIIGASGAVCILASVLRSCNGTSNSQLKDDCLRAFFNVSISPSNVIHIIESDIVPFLVNALGDMDISERILSILSNLVAVPEGRKSISNCRDALMILIDVLNWTDSPGCQEKAAYVLMVLAHKVYGNRPAMIEAGIVSSLLELTLLGSTLAQKRASRILGCLRIDKGKQVLDGRGGSGLTAVSAPICETSSSLTVMAMKGELLKEGAAEEEETMSEERRAVKQLVQQSLENNMKRIVKRANLPQDFAPSDHFKSLTTSSTSKSLPF
ncbi:hypothetical protein ACLOJK_034480 [Asimina triloba]